MGRNKRTRPSRQQQQQQETSVNSTAYSRAGSLMSSGEKVFRIPELLEMILKLLDTKELLTLRLLTSYTKVTSTDLLLKQDRLQMTFTFCSTSQSYIVQKNGEEKTRLVHINSILSSSSSSGHNGLVPTTIRFDEGNLELEEVQEFFSLYGNNIKALKLNLKFKTNGQKRITTNNNSKLYNGQGRTSTRSTMSLCQSTENVDGDDDNADDYTKAATLGRLLLDQLSTLEHLEFGELSAQSNFRTSSRKTKLLFPDKIKKFKDTPVQLPNLTTLVACSRWCQCKKILKEIVEAAINLKTFKDHCTNLRLGYHWQDTDLFLPIEKMIELSQVDADEAEWKKFAEQLIKSTRVRNFVSSMINRAMSARV